MSPTSPYGLGPTVGEPTMAEVTDDLKQAVADLTGHDGTVVGAVEVRTATDDPGDKLVITVYVDGQGHTHVEVAEMWPPDYHVGMVVADVVVN